MKVVKRIFNSLIKRWFYCLPYKFIVNKYPELKNNSYKFIDILEEVYYDRFFKESKLVNDFDNFIEIAKKYDKCCLIKTGNWEYKVINFCFIREMLANIIWCLENGYKPLIDIYPTNGNYKEYSNLWEKMYRQPFEGVIGGDTGGYMVCPVKVHCVVPRMQDARDDKKVEFWNKMFREFVVYNDYCQKYIDSEYDEIVKGKKVLACLVRGTDYIKLRPKGHPKQPTVEELVDKVSEVMTQDNLDYIYLATEEKKISDVFKDKFAGKVLENKRKYFDEAYESNKIELVSQVTFDREDDDFLKILEYMSSIDLLSKCDSIVAGLCGGSEAAVYYNGNKYKTKFLFDKGVY